jgi:hypothetical protein
MRNHVLSWENKCGSKYRHDLKITERKADLERCEKVTQSVNFSNNIL